jgi:diguanylate cyclase (GGDEF)-like protein
VTRRTDYVARYAGDEFMIILPNTSGEAAMVLAERLRTAVEESRFCIDGHEVAATVSIGVASFPESGTDVDSMLKAVDQAMYRSKRAGKNRVSKAW